MGIPVVIVASGGMPVTVAANGYGTPMTVATNGYGVPVTIVASGGLPVVGISGGAAYTGPGDVVSGATAFWGLRAYNAAKAAALSPCLDLGLTTDGTSPVTINFTASGYIDTAAVTAAFAANKTKVMKLYDQVGSNHLIPAFGGGHSYAPILTSNAGPGGNTFAMDNGVGAGALDSTNNITMAQPYSYLTLSKARTGVSGNRQLSGGMTNTGLYLIIRTATGNLGLSSGSGEIGQTFSVNAWHAASAVAASGAAALDVDGAQGGGAGIGSAGFSAEKIGFGTTGLGSFWDGWTCELGIWPSAFSTGNQTALNTNMHTRWGF